MAYKVGRCLLQKHLDNLGLSQKELANRLGVEKQQINRYVKDRQKMSYEVAYNISVIIGCDMDELYEWEVG